MSPTVTRLSPHERRAIAARAATIYERGQAVRRGPLALPAGTLRLWNQAFSPGDPAAFVRRLAWDGFDADNCVEGPGETASTGEETSSPAWLEWLDRILDEVPALRADLGTGAFTRSTAPDAPAFDDIWTTLPRAARRALRLEAPAALIDRLSPSALETLERQLLLEAGRFGDPALYTQFQETNAPAADARYPAFVAHMLEGGLVTFLVEHAALARQLATLLQTWVEATVEFLRRLDADVSALALAFGCGTAPGRVVAIVPALSDPHHGRRRVQALEFESGLRLVYKPRSVRLDDAFANLLLWLNRGLAHPLPTLRTVDRGTHGWVEMARHEPLADRSEAAAWFHRAGALMAVTSVLGARDLHHENVVATRNGPVLVDVELLLQPERRTTTPFDETGGTRMGPTVESSCLSTGLLTLIDLTSEGEPHDSGGLCGERSGALPFPKRVWQHRGTDALQVVEESVFETSTTHTVLVDGQIQRPSDWAPDIVAGFREAYRHMLAHRDEMAAGPMRAFASCRLRVLPRPTNQYAMLAWLLATPRYQRDGAAPSCAVDVLHRAFNREVHRPALWSVAIAERRAMTGLDVPYFSVPADGTDVSCEADVVAVGYFGQSGLDVALARLGALSGSDLEAQMTLLARALSESVHSRYAAPLAWDDQAGSSRAEDFEREAMAHASWLAEQLRSRALRTADGLRWPYRPGAGGPGWRDHHLYDGTMGPALFFSALASITGDARWVETAEGALASMHAHAVRHPMDTLPADEPTGAGNGLGSIVYGLTVTSVLLARREDLVLARDLARGIRTRIDAAADFDVVDGLAGAVLALLALYDTDGDADVLATAAMAGDRLVAGGRIQADGMSWSSRDGSHLLGYAHGVAGIGAALTRLAAATGDVRHARAARLALRLLRRRHLQGAGNWPIAVDDSRGSGGLMMGWCHGAPGIALAAIEAAVSRPSPSVARSVQAALGRVADWQPAQSDHVCCGLLARAEALAAAGVATGDRGRVEAARALTRQVMARARRRGHFRLSGAGTDYRVSDPGFFQGLSGIGYGLLRLAHPERLPSVPSFDAPRSRLRYCSPGGDHASGGRVQPVTQPNESASAEFTS